MPEVATFDLCLKAKELCTFLLKEKKSIHKRDFSWVLKLSLLSIGQKHNTLSSDNKQLSYSSIHVQKF